MILNVVAQKVLEKRHRAKCFLFFIVVVLWTVVSCANTGDNGLVSEPTILIYANLTENGVDWQMVDAFNRTHPNVQIEVRDYLDEAGSTGQSGKDRLFAEIAAGKTPDIIDLGQDVSHRCRLPYEIMLRKGILEDLWPYIENDPDLGYDGIVKAPLKAAEIEGKLGVIFEGVIIETMIGAKSVVGDRNSWSLAEMLKNFETMPEGSYLTNSILTKDDMFQYVFSMALDSYIDWETGKCFFENTGFRSALEFINQFPAEFDKTVSGGLEEAWEMDMKRLLNGQQMLSPMIYVRRAGDIQFLDIMYGLGGEAAFIGYPVEDNSIGSYFRIPVNAHKIAMSACCKNKDDAWEFMRQIILPKFKNLETIQNNEEMYPNIIIPVNRSDYELLKQLDMKTICGDRRQIVPGPIVELHNATADEVQRFEDFINCIDKISLYDSEVYDMVYETATAYFAGDKTLDETVDLIQRRVSLYVDELR